MIYRKNRLTDVAKGGGLFLALGPPLGAALFTQLSFMIEVMSNGVDSSDLLLMPFAFLLLVTFSYAAFAPAIATGLVAGLMRRHLHHIGPCLLIGLIGGVLSFFWAKWTLANNVRDAEVVYFFLLIGLVNSTICAMFFRTQHAALSLSLRNCRPASVAMQMNNNNNE